MVMPKELFTKIYDLLLWKYSDINLVLVYGKIERFTTKAGYWYASHTTIAEQLGLNRKTVLLKIHKLIEEGYLVDYDSGKRNITHRIIVSNKLAQEYQEFLNYLSYINENQKQTQERVKNGEVDLISLIDVQDLSTIYNDLISFGRRELELSQQGETSLRGAIRTVNERKCYMNKQLINR